MTCNPLSRPFVDAGAKPTPAPKVARNKKSTILASRPYAALSGKRRRQAPEQDARRVASKWPQPRRILKSNLMMRTLFVQVPSYEGFDGGAGSRYQARREIRSFWYPVWLAQAAAMVPDSKLIDAVPHGIDLATILREARNYDLAIVHTSTPSFESDVRAIEMLKAANPALKAGFVGAHVAVGPHASLAASPAIDFVAGKEFDFTIREMAEAREWGRIAGLSYRDPNGAIKHNGPREILEDMDRLPFVTPVYKRHLSIEKYFIGYLQHPYLSLHTGRGCKSRCTFCLWPQTVGGHRYRTRSVGNVIEEVVWCRQAFPQVKELFFDDDTFTDDRPRAEAIARELGRLGIAWSCNAKPNVSRETLMVMRDNGLRLLLVGYESGNQRILHNIKKGLRVDTARIFAKTCHELGITVHGTFILGLPGETKETIEETIRFATEINPHTIQVSIAAPYPGTFLYRQAIENGWLDSGDAALVDQRGTQIAPLHYPHLSHHEIFSSVEDFYRQFYFRAAKIAAIVGEMVHSPRMLRRRLREGVEFFQFLRQRRRTVHTDSEGQIEFKARQ
jgi:hopanoid biosynthesis associated radical SAM protein HpnJ